MRLTHASGEEVYPVLSGTSIEHLRGSLLKLDKQYLSIGIIVQKIGKQFNKR